MSLDLVDLSTIKIHQEAHAFLKAQADIQKTCINELVRQIIHEYVLRQISVFSMADEICKSKGLPGISGDFK